MVDGKESARGGGVFVLVGGGRRREGERERGGGVLVEDSANFTAKALERADIPFGVARENVKALGECFFTFQFRVSHNCG